VFELQQTCSEPSVPFMLGFSGSTLVITEAGSAHSEGIDDSVIQLPLSGFGRPVVPLAVSVTPVSFGAVWMAQNAVTELNGWFFLSSSCARQVILLIFSPSNGSNPSILWV
jgi:hypothetical protein